MEIPLTPVLMVMQSHPPAHQIQDAANEITTLLDDFTFDEQETRILEILADLGPEDFVRCLKLISQYTVRKGWPREEYEVSYLERLYVDMNGAQFQALCDMTKAKLLAVKCGSLERVKEVAGKALAGETTPEVPESMDYGTAKLTSPSTLGRRSFPCDTKFLLDGSITGKWTDHVGYGYGSIYDPVRHFKMRLTDLAVVRHIHVSGKHEIVSLFDIKSFSDEQHRTFWFTTANLCGIVMGAGLFAAAKGAAKKALIGLFQVAIPTAGQYITEHEEEILKMKYGRQFLFAWQLLSLAMAAYGLYQLFSPAGKSLIGALTKGKDDLISNNPGNDVAKGAGKAVAAVEDALADVKKNVVDKGIGPSANSRAGSSPIMDALKNRAPIHPGVPPPAAITGGKCIATGKSELEILHEMRKHPNPDKLDVFQKDGDFFLVERTGSSPAGKPTGYERCTSFTKIIDIFDDLGSAKKKLLDVAKFNASSEIEVGIYKRLIGGRMRFVVINGQKGSVAHPAEGWIPVGHYHHGADGVFGYHFPAVQDMAGTIMVAGKRITKKHTEIIFSHDKNGRVIEIEYGVDPDDLAGPLFVKTMDGLTKKFEAIYPDELIPELNAINANTRLTELGKLIEKAKVFKRVDSKVYYAAWWASLF